MTMGARKLAHPNFLQSEGKNQRSRSGADGITGTRSGRLFFRNPRGGCCSPRPTFSPTRRNIETVFELSLPPGQIFRHIRWAETNFKTFLLSSLQLKLSSAVTDPSSDSSHSSHEPRTFLSFWPPPRSYFTGKNIGWVEARRGWTTTVSVERIPFPRWIRIDVLFRGGLIFASIGRLLGRKFFRWRRRNEMRMDVWGGGKKKRKTLEGTFPHPWNEFQRDRLKWIRIAFVGGGHRLWGGK